MCNPKLFAFAVIGLIITSISVGANPSNILLEQGESALAKGQINTAIRLLQNTQQQDSRSTNSQLSTIALAEALLRSGQLDLAETELNKVYQAAKAGTSKELLGEITLRYGHLYAAKGNAVKTETWYRQALLNAESANDQALAAAALINLAKQTKQVEELNQAQLHIAKLPANEEKNTLLLALGYQAGQQNQLQLAHDSLQAVLNSTQNNRTKAQALGLLGHLYEQQHRATEALQLTEHALTIDNNPDLHLQWTWQRARLLEMTGNKAAALNAYRSAVEQLQDLRLDIPVVYQGGESSFQQTFVPLYLGFIELLLHQAEQAPNESKQPLLNEVVQTWEQLKSVELQDYFKEACALKQQSQITKLDPHTAIFYPIILADHLALVIRFADKIKAYRVNRTPAEIGQLVNTLFGQLNTYGTLTDHKTLYQWLIAPLKADLEQQQIDTIVYLPDGPLRKIPFSILSDGHQFLIEQYALATVPGLSMLAVPSSHQNREDILLAGMSKPGPVVEELLANGIDLNAPPAENRVLSRSLKRRVLSVQNTPIKNLNFAERNLRSSQLKEDLALPGVTEELQMLSNLTKSPILENADFLLNRFNKEVNQGHSAVHIASHGYFAGDPKKSFIMAYDHLLTMDKLTELFQTEAFHDRPIELVTLSACKTAEGDDRSPLGLSGIVVKSGVKSAIGTLWWVGDEAAKLFFSEFYLRYQQPGVTKAKAMQNTLKQLMKNKDLSHPSNWGPFVLVGEWH